MRYRGEPMSELLAQLEALKLDFQTLKQNLKNEGIPFIKSTEHHALRDAIYRCKKKIQVEQNCLEQISSPIVFNKVRDRIETAGFVNVNDQELRSLEYALFCQWHSSNDRGFSCRNSKEYKRIEQAIRRLTLSSLEDELIFLRRYLKDNGLLTRDLQNYNRVTRSIRSLKRQIDPLFYYQKSLKKLVIKERKLEFQFEMLKQTMKNGGILTRNCKEYEALRSSIVRCKASIVRCKKKFGFENPEIIYL